MINSQLVLAEVTVDDETLESIVKTALVATLSYVTSTDQIVAFSVVSSRRRRLQQTTTVAFSVRVEGTAEFAASYAETIVSDFRPRPVRCLTTASTASTQGARAHGAGGRNDYTRSWPRRADFRRPPTFARRGGRRRSGQPGGRRRGHRRRRRHGGGGRVRRPGRDQGEDESEDKGADSAGGGLAVLGIALAAFLGLLCVGGYVRMKMFGSQDRSDRDWARDLHGSGVSNPAAARDPWGRPTPIETRGVEMASTHASGPTARSTA